MTRQRRMGWLLAAAGGAVLVVSSYVMSGRIGAINRAEPPPTFAFQRIEKRAVTFAGRGVAFEDATDASGNPLLRVTYGTDTAEVSVEAPVLAGMDELGVYGEWLAVLAFEDYGPRGPHAKDALTADDEDDGGSGGGRGASAGEGEKNGRLVVVSRRPAPDLDPETWGSVKRRQWTFEFVELLPSGGFERKRWRFPIVSDYKVDLSKLPESVRVLPELDERRWEYYAALHAMPPLQVPRFKFKADAFTRLGWTLPGAALSGLVLTAGVLLIFAPARRKGAEVEGSGQV